MMTISLTDTQGYLDFLVRLLSILICCILFSKTWLISSNLLKVLHKVVLDIVLSSFQCL